VGAAGFAPPCLSPLSDRHVADKKATRGSSHHAPNTQNPDGTYDGHLEVKDPNEQTVVEVDPNSLVVSGEAVVNGGSSDWSATTGLMPLAAMTSWVLTAQPGYP
jgi:hypothetical protein